MLGTVLGIGGFVAIVGLSQTASGQIGSAFNRLDATQVTVADTAAGKASGSGGVGRSLSSKRALPPRILTPRASVPASTR